MQGLGLSFLTFLLLVISLGGTAFAQLSAPLVESVYGGRISAITGYQVSADTSRIFVATESANSVFYADVYTVGSAPVFG